MVCGRRRERFPEASIYNRLCDREWDTPVGQAKACGGDALARMSALDEVGGYNPSLIAGEEPEMCVRLRQRGWEIWRLDAEMTLHDAAMTRFSQWWKRTRRGGYAAAEGMAMHGSAPEYHGVRAVIRALFWGAVLPVATVMLALAVSPWALLLLLAYPAQVARIALRDGGTRAAWESAIFLMLGKFAEVAGVAEYVVGRWSAGGVASSSTSEARWPRASAAQQRPSRCSLLGHIELGLHLRPAGLAHARTKLGLGQQRAKACAQPLDVARRDDEAGHAVLDQFLHAGNAARDHWQPARHGLHQHHRYALGEAGQHQHVGLLEDLGDRRLALVAEEAHRTGKAQRRGPGFEPRAIRAVADNGEAQVGMRRPDVGDGLEQQRGALHRREAADEQDALAVRSVRASPVVRREHAAMDDRQLVPMRLPGEQHHLRAREVADAGDEAGTRHFIAGAVLEWRQQLRPGHAP